MRKIVFSLTVLSLLICFMTTAYAEVSLNPAYVFNDGEYLYTFGDFNTEDSPDEVGVAVNGKNYKLKGDQLDKSKQYGKFGIGISDPNNILGSSYWVTPYIIKENLKITGEAIAVEKEPVSNLKYLGPKDDLFDGLPVIHDNFTNGVHIFNNYANLLSANVLPSLKGNSYITIPNPIAGSVPAGIKNAWGGNSTLDWISFDLYKSATIRVLTSGNIDPLTYPKYGFTANTTTENGGYYFSRFNSDYPGAEQAKMDRMYTKHIDVAENGFSTVVLPNAAHHGTNKWGYVVVIEFDDKEVITPAITSLAYAGPVDPGYTYKVEKHDNFQNGNLLYCNYDNIAASNLDAAYAGKPYIIMDNPIAGSISSVIKTAWGDASIPWVTFEINKTATIRIFTDGDALAYGNDGYTKNTAPAYYFQRLNTTHSTTTNITTMYTKTYEVTPGETVTVSIPNAAWLGTSKWGHIVVVDFEE